MNQKVSHVLDHAISEVHKVVMTWKRTDATKASRRSAVLSSMISCCFSTLDSGTWARMARRFDLYFVMAKQSILFAKYLAFASQNCIMIWMVCPVKNYQCRMYQNWGWSDICQMGWNNYNLLWQITMLWSSTLRVLCDAVLCNSPQPDCGSSPSPPLLSPTVSRTLRKHAMADHHFQLQLHPAGQYAAQNMISVVSHVSHCTHPQSFWTS